MLAFRSVPLFSLAICWSCSLSTCWSRCGALLVHMVLPVSLGAGRSGHLCRLGLHGPDWPDTAAGGLHRRRLCVLSLLMMVTKAACLATSQKSLAGAVTRSAAASAASAVPPCQAAMPPGRCQSAAAALRGGATAAAPLAGAAWRGCPPRSWTVCAAMRGCHPSSPCPPINRCVPHPLWTSRVTGQAHDHPCLVVCRCCGAATDHRRHKQSTMRCLVGCLHGARFQCVLQS